MLPYMVFAVIISTAAAVIAGREEHMGIGTRIGVGLTTFALLVLIVALAGCALPAMTRADMTAFDRDHYDCYRETSFPQASAVGMPMLGGGAFALAQAQPARPRPDLYRLCMRARGYREAD